MIKRQIEMSFQKGARLKPVNKKINGDIPHDVPAPSEERAFQSASFRASLTIEASLALPIFLFFTVCLIHFLILISLQCDIQLHIDEAARDIGKSVYMTSDSEILSLLEGNFLVVRSKILDDDLTERLDNSRVRGGASGISAALSSYARESGILDIEISYIYDFPFLPSSIGSLQLIQKSYTRAWIGTELESAGASQSDDEEIVYITPSGTAYHKNTSCPYLDLSIRSVSASTVSDLRNKSGGRYSRCSCVLSGATSVYVTDYGVLYHSSLTCPKLKRSVSAVAISEVGNRHACSKCCGSSTEETK